MLRSAVLLLLFSVSAFGQSAAKPLSFEVAEIKINKSGAVSVSSEFLHGQVRLINAPMWLLVSGAYHVRPEAIAGAPGWFNADRFDVIAKSTPDTSENDLRLMLQSLLAERFKLAVHKEEKVSAAYALVAGKGAPKLKPSEPGKPAERRCAPVEGSPEQFHVGCRHTTMEELAQSLRDLAPRYITLPVVDQTGLKGSYEFQLDWTPMAAPSDASHGGEEHPATIETAGGFTIFDAIAKLGLKLERAKLPVPTIVIDRVERP